MPRINQSNAVGPPPIPPTPIDPSDGGDIITELWSAFLAHRQARCKAAGVDYLHEYMQDAPEDFQRALVDTLERMLRHNPIRVQS